MKLRRKYVKIKVTENTAKTILKIMEEYHKIKHDNANILAIFGQQLECAKEEMLADECYFAMTEIKERLENKLSEDGKHNA